MRYDEERGVYRDCKFCHGKGCLACPKEADAAYKREFPDGPKPIATYPTPEGSTKQDVAAIIQKALNDHLPGVNGKWVSLTDNKEKA